VPKAVTFLEYFPPKWIPVRRRKCEKQKNLAWTSEGGEGSAQAFAVALGDLEQLHIVADVGVVGVLRGRLGELDAGALEVAAQQV
jgi:hypothetical protein